jgi:hypothetical protein
MKNGRLLVGKHILKPETEVQYNIPWYVFLLLGNNCEIAFIQKLLLGNDCEIAFIQKLLLNNGTLAE